MKRSPLLAGERSPGRRYEKVDAADNLRSVRLGRAYRFVCLLPPCEGSGAAQVATGACHYPAGDGERNGAKG